MDSLKRKWHNLPLRTFFMLTILISFSVVVLLSGLIIWGCAVFRHNLLPDSDSVYLSIQKKYEGGGSSSESYLLKYNDIPVQLSQIVVNGDDSRELSSEYPKYSIEKIEPSYNLLSPKRKLAYTACGITMVAAPAFLSLAGIISCSFYFYRRKLKLPLRLLSDATVQIAAQNLDFRPEYDCDDEMGRLCRSFMLMQDALYANNREMWAMLEERKNLQASVSHDLRNPIAIIQGYAEHLENKAKKNNLSPESALRMAQNIGLAAKRMENYACSLHKLNQLEDIMAQKSKISVLKLSEDLKTDFSLIMERSQKKLHVSFHGLLSRFPAKDAAAIEETPAYEENNASGFPTEPLGKPDIFIKADSALIYRVIENIIGNALRFSQKEVFLDFALETRFLSITVRDDGSGFPQNVLDKTGKTIFPSGLSFGQEEHMGIGIAVSRILCHKHGGTLKLSNSAEGGAMVKVSFDVS